MSFCLCTLAVHAPYRQRALRMIADAPDVPWVVLTDEPGDFASTGARAFRHEPTGPMAVDYLRELPATGNNRGAAAYHDKRFVFARALREFDTAIFLDADSRLTRLPGMDALPPGLSVLPLVRRSISEHLRQSGGWRLPAFERIALDLFGTLSVLDEAPWCHEAIMGIRRDGGEQEFVATWGQVGIGLQAQGVFSGEGGAIGLAALKAGWRVDFEAVTALGEVVMHEGGGPKAC